MKITKREALRAMYLAWLNDFGSSKRFAEYFSLTFEQAVRVIHLGRILSQRAHD